MDISCAPVEQLFRKAIVIGISWWEAQPAPQCQSNGAADTQRAEMSPAFRCTGNGASKKDSLSAVRCKTRTRSSSRG